MQLFFYCTKKGCCRSNNLNPLGVIHDGKINGTRKLYDNLAVYATYFKFIHLFCIFLLTKRIISIIVTIVVTNYKFWRFYK